MKETLSGKYIAILALAAVVILLVGWRFRPRPTEDSPPSPTETAVLEQRVRREQAAGISQYLASRAAELADQAVFLPARGAAGVRYETPTKVLTVDGTGELIEPALIAAETSLSVPPAPLATSRQPSDHWALIVGRSAKDRPLWAAAIQSVSQSAVCGGVPYQELVFNMTLDKAFAGSGVFNLDGNLMGIAIPCAGALHIVAVESVPGVLAASAGPDHAFVERFGFRAAPIPEQWKDLYPRLNGLIITETLKGRWADRTDLLPGDLILTEERELRTTNMPPEVRVARPGRLGFIRAKTDSRVNGTGVAMLAATSPLPELLVAHGTAAERAGLHSGDHLVSILGQRNASISALSKMLAEPNGKPIRIVFERGNKRGVVEVPGE